MSGFTATFLFFLIGAGWSGSDLGYLFLDPHYA
jgi:hypothetical protein